MNPQDRIAELERANAEQERHILRLRAELAEAKMHLARKDAFILREERRRAAGGRRPASLLERTFDA